MIAVLIVALLAFGLADFAARWPNFNPDESRWVSRAHYVAALADPFGPTWADQYMTRGQPPLGSYAMGIGLLAQGRDLETNAPWDFSLTWEQNIALGHKPVPEDLAAGRRTSAALVALTAVALIGVARIFLTMPWAIAAGALYAIHPFTVYIGSIAMSDALFGALIALAAWAAAAFARSPSWGRAILVGVLLGLGGATKLSPLAVAAGLSAAGVLLFVLATIRHRRFARREAAYAGRGLVIGIAALLTFIASYPYLWSDPITHTRHLFAFRVDEMAAQASDWPVMAVPNRVEALRRVNVNFTERYNFSASLISLAGGPTAAPLVRQVEFAIPVLGIILMTGLAVRDGPYSPRALALVIVGGQVLVTVFGMRSEFDRYHVPMALLGAVAAAVALAWLARSAQSFLGPKERMAPATVDVPQ
jgi:4-amino-4-deoxy-L-arabinose transferase-like glycosyltransferase